MFKKIIEGTITSIYKDKDNVLFEGIMFDDIGKDIISILESFHMKELFMLELEDDYFCGIRANHFCIEYGYNEHFLGKDNYGLILVTANHKGWRQMTLLKDPSPYSPPDLLD